MLPEDPESDKSEVEVRVDELTSDWFKKDSDHQMQGKAYSST